MNKWIGNGNLQMDGEMSTEGNDLTVIRIWGGVAQRGYKEIEVMTLSGDQLYRFYRLYNFDGSMPHTSIMRPAQLLTVIKTTWHDTAES